MLFSKLRGIPVPSGPLFIIFSEKLEKFEEKKLEIFELIQLESGKLREDLFKFSNSIQIYVKYKGEEIFSSG